VALYQQLADAIRRKIVSGEMQSGEQLPSEAALEREHKVGRVTVRGAIQILRAEHLVHTVWGSGTFVSDPKDAPMPYLASVVHSKSQRGETGPDAFKRQLRDSGRTGDESIVVQVKPAPEDIADRLGLEPGAPVLLRSRLQTIEGRPSAMADSWFRAEMVEGTEIAQPVDIPRGTDRVMEELGHGATHRRDEVTARMPTPAEAQALQIAGGVPVVLVVATELTDGDEPVEVYRLTLPADRHVLIYDVPKDI
jgi:GntR family transcriptional regulator